MAGTWGEGLWQEYGWGYGDAQNFLEVQLPTFQFYGTAASGVYLEITLPAFEFVGTSASFLEVELPTVEFTGVTASYLNVTLPAFEASLSCNPIGLTIKLPAFEFVGVMASYLRPIELSAFTFEGVSASVLKAITLPAFTAEFVTSSYFTATLQPFTASFESTIGRCYLNVTLPAFKFAGTLDYVTIGTLTITLPAFQATFEGSGSIHGSLEVTLPAFRFYGTLMYATDAVVVYAVSTKDGSLTEYSSYNMNSFATIGGVRLGASSSGLFNLSGADDAGVDIAGSFETGVHDGGVRNIKWMPNAVVVMKTDGVTYLTPIMDGVAKGQKSIVSTGSVMTAKNVRTDKGPDAVNVGVKFENYVGSAFEVASIEMLTEITKRVGK